MINVDQVKSILAQMRREARETERLTGERDEAAWRNIRKYERLLKKEIKEQAGGLL